MDSSAFLKLYLEEAESDRAEEILSSDSQWVSARHTSVEVRRNLTRALEGPSLVSARRQFQRDWENTAVVELTVDVCEAAAQLAELTGARSLDALHLGALQIVGAGALPLITFDVRQAQVARGLGWVVLGV